ncbi:MAG: small multi-drug export protein [Candidatus Omnitrophica bacterium]|nr:small multi-drug export protein [Candidatus Omnitrophota bacterium]
MIEAVLDGLGGIPRELAVMILGALPVSELRGAIPLGLYYGFGLPKTFLLAVAGNLVPVVPLLILLEPVSNGLRRFPLWARFFEWLFERTRRRAETVQKYEALGLILFVAVPLPVTGAWTAAVAATLFKIRFRYAFWAIVCGVLIAGGVVSTLCTLGIMGWQAMAE